MASNKHAQIRYKVLDDCFSNFRRKFYFNDLLERCNEALRELYGEDHTGIKTRTLRSDINYIRTRATEADPDLEKDFYLLRHTICPAVLTENLFMDNPADCAFLLSPEGQQSLVDLHVDGIISHLDSL